MHQKVFLLSRLLCVFLMLGSASSTWAQQSGKPSDIPIEAFASLPDFDRPKLSPDGENIAALMKLKGRLIVVVQHISGKNRVIMYPAIGSEVKNFYWANNDRLLVSYSLVGRHLRGAGMTRLASVNRHDASDSIWAVKDKKDDTLRRKRAIGRGSAQFQDQITDILPDDPDHFLLNIDADRDGRAELRKINVYTGEYKDMLFPHTGIQHWYAAPDHTISLGTGFHKSKRKMIFKDKNTGKWVNITKKEWRNNYSIVSVTQNSNIVFATGSQNYGTDKLVKLDVISGEIIETVFSDNEYDIDHVVHHPDTGQPAGAAYMDDFWRIKYFDPQLDLVQQSVDKITQGQNNRIIDKARGKNIYLILSTSDREPGIYFLHDVKTKKTRSIGLRYRKIDPNLMAPTKAVEIKVRDGSIIPAYLTLPLGKDPKDLPTVILPHGGPHSRDTADWDWWTQFLVSRGYAVLRPNFRGSTGLGYKHYIMGRKQWGGLMQDDITDATKWMISEGITDPERVCIAGASYGGYAAIFGTIKEPGLYKCAISINGVMNIPSMVLRDKKFIGGRSWSKSMRLEGASKKDISPYHQSKKIHAPVLLFSSKNDSRVPYKQSRNLYKKLKKRKVDTGYVLIEDGGHTMNTGASRLTMLREMEKFLDKHIGD